MFIKIYIYIYKLKLSTIRKFNLSIKKKKKTIYPKTKEELSKKLALKKKKGK